MGVPGTSSGWRMAVAAGVLLAAAGCRSAEARHQRASAGSHPPATPAAADTVGPAFGDSILTLDSAAVVLFWTPPVDTLDPAARAEAIAEMRATAAWADDFLEGYRIPLHATRAHGVLVRPPAGGRRFVDFRGLDYPFGFVLIDPGYPEQFLTGLVTEDDLRDALIDYFDLEDGDSSGVFRTNWPVAGGRNLLCSITWHHACSRLTLWNAVLAASAARSFVADAGCRAARRVGGARRCHGGGYRHPARSGRSGT